MAEDFHVNFSEDGLIRVSREQVAEWMFPYRTTTPEWYAARMPHRIGCLSTKSWADMPELFAWLEEFVAILMEPELVEQYRRQLLSDEELEAVRQEQADIETYGF